MAALTSALRQALDSLDSNKSENSSDRNAADRSRPGDGKAQRGHIIKTTGNLNVIIAAAELYLIVNMDTHSCCSTPRDVQPCGGQLMKRPRPSGP